MSNKSDLNSYLPLIYTDGPHSLITESIPELNIDGVDNSELNGKP